MKNLYLIILVLLSSVFFSTNATAQLVYSCNMDGGGGDCGRDWDNNGFIAAYTSADCAGSSDVIYDNVYGSGTSSTIGAWNNVAITGHTGGEIELDFQTRLLDYYSPYTDRSATEWGTLKVYYKTSTPTEASPGTQIGSDITSATDCQTHTITFDPGTTITNLYIALIYTIGSGDNDIIFDNIALTERTCGEPTSLTSSSITASTATLSWTAPSPAPSVGYDYYYSTSASTPINSATPSGSVTVTTDNLSGLSAGFTYNYWVRSDCGSSDYSAWIAGGTFTTAAAIPTITSFTPSNGCGSFTSVVITGTNFGGTSAITIGATAVSSFVVDSDTQITATVGSGTTGVIQVTNTAGSVSSSGSFTFNSNGSITTNPDATVSIAAGNSDVISVVASGASAYQWQFSEDGSSGWSDIADGTPANVTYSGATTANLTIQPNTSVAGVTGYYKCVVQCGGVSSTVAAVTFVQYCDNSGGLYDGGIVGVTFGTIDNTTGNSEVYAYSDYYPDFEGTFLRSTAYDLSVYINTDGNYTYYQTVWIDWDGSGTFDADEDYDLGTATNQTNGLSGGAALSITVPSDAVEGDIRMRVVCNYSSSTLACTSFSYGEVEDYKLSVRYPSVWSGVVDSDWHDKLNWTGDVLPTTLSLVEIPAAANQPVVTEAVSITQLTIDPGATATVSAGSLTVSGDMVNDGMFFISGGTLDLDGDYTAAAGSIDMIGSGANLTLGNSTMTNPGALNLIEGTVTYDGKTQDVQPATYRNLTISSAGVKTARGTINVNGNLITAATSGSRLDMVANQLNVKGDLTVGAQNGLDLTDASALLTFNGTVDQTITHPGNATVAGGATVSEGFESATSWTITDTPSQWDFEQSGVPVTNNTGPVNPNGGSLFAHFDASGGSTGQTADIEKTFDFSAYNSPQLSYYYHMYGATMGSLAVQVNTGGGWTSLWSVTSQQHSNYYASWTQNSIDLSTYAGEASCQIRFLATRGSGITSDIGLEDIVVSDLVGAITGNFEFVNLTLNNTGGNAVLSSAVEIDGALTLTSGDLDASSFDLTLSASATASAGSDASHVIGTMIKTTTATSAFTFPLGDGTWYKAIGITPDATSSTVWTAEYFNSEYATTTVDPANTGDIDHISAYEYWDLDKSGSANAVIALPWVSQNAVSVYADLRLAHFDGTDWDMITATPVGDNTSGVVTSGSAVTTYSPFTLASSTSSNTLPIELVSFSGEKKDNRNILNWTTASEINNAYFTVEKSYNGFDFEWVGTQEGTSPSTQIINYSLSDYDVLETLNYYRLKQTDFDGKFEYSNTISIDNRVDNSFKEIMGRTNLLGQEVDEFYNGIVIVRYKDGTSQKFYQFK